MRAIVIGAGIGGLTAALALLRRGIDVDVYERARTLAEAGAGLHCSPNGTRVLMELGLADEMRDFSVIPTLRDIRLWNDGRAWPLGNHNARAVERYGAPYLLMHRGDLYAMLLNAVLRVKPDAIHVGATCVDADETNGSVTAYFDDASTATADLLVAADGVHSVVRARLFGEATPQFTGVTAWRGLIPVERVPGISPDATSNWIGPDGSITIYGVRGGTLINFVGLKTSTSWQAESWTEAGTRSECLADFAGWHPDIIEAIANIDVPYRWGLFLHPPLEQWTRGRITLLGDACHAMLPFLGQGANTAIEDGMILARALAAEPDVEIALQRYEAARRDRTTTIAAQSVEQGKRIWSHQLADADAAARYIESHWSSTAVATWYDWIFEYDAVNVPV